MICFISIGETREAERVLWYAFEGTGDTVKDVSGNGNDGSITGAKRVPGKFGKGIDIGKKDEYVEIPDVLQQKTNPKGTILFWFKPNWNGGEGGAYRLFDANTGAIYWLIGQGKEGGGAGTFGFWFEDAADADFQNWQTPSNVIKAGEWHHVAATWDFEKKKEAKFYINGKEDSQVAGLGEFPPLNTNPKIGFNVGTGYMPAANGADSVIDEFAIYSKVLDEKEVKSDMDTLAMAVEPVGKLSTTWAGIKAGF